MRCVGSLLLVLFSAACGGAARDRGGGQDGGAADPEASLPDDPLPECVPGFPRGTAGRQCNWTVEGFCYEERRMACACACPRDQANVTCSSGFGGPDSATPVECW
jgi:hypothetical protein